MRGPLGWWRRRRARAEAAGRLYRAAVVAGRQPCLYASLGVPDTPLGRFELIGLAVFLILYRLKRVRQGGPELSQELLRVFAADIDRSLRELGVSDTRIGRRVRQLGEAFYGRIAAYDAAIEAAEPRAALRDALARTVFAEARSARGAAGLAEHVLATVARLSAEDDAGLLAGRLTVVPGAAEARDR